jgi:hypothetical protein
MAASLRERIGRNRLTWSAVVQAEADVPLSLPRAQWPMCRNIKTLFNFDPPATELEIRDASLQFVRKLSGFNVPSRANEAAFERAVEEVAASARKMIRSLVTNAEPRTRDAVAAKARERAAARFGDRR